MGKKRPQKKDPKPNGGSLDSGEWIMPLDPQVFNTGFQFLAQNEPENTTCLDLEQPLTVGSKGADVAALPSPDLLAPHSSGSRAPVHRPA